MTTNTSTTGYPTPGSTPGETSGVHFEGRWAEWQRRGHAQQQRSNRRMWILSTVTLTGLVVWLIATLV